MGTSALTCAAVGMSSLISVYVCVCVCRTSPLYSVHVYRLLYAIANSVHGQHDIYCFEDVLRGQWFPRFSLRKQKLPRAALKGGGAVLKVNNTVFGFVTPSETLRCTRCLFPTVRYAFVYSAALQADVFCRGTLANDTPVRR